MSGADMSEAEKIDAYRTAVIEDVVSAIPDRFMPDDSREGNLRMHVTELTRTYAGFVFDAIGAVHFAGQSTSRSEAIAEVAGIATVPLGQEMGARADIEWTQTRSIGSDLRESFIRPGAYTLNEVFDRILADSRGDML